MGRRSCVLHIGIIRRGCGTRQFRGHDAHGATEGVAEKPVNGDRGDGNQRDENEAQQAIEYDPQSYLGHWGLQACYGFAGHHEEAVAQSDSVIAQLGPSVWSVYLRGISLANLGRTSEVDALYRELSDRAIRDYVQPTPLAMIAAALGRMDEAFGHVERALD